MKGQRADRLYFSAGLVIHLWVFSSQGELICSMTGSCRQLLGRALSSCLFQWQTHVVSEIWLFIMTLGSAAVAASSDCSHLFLSSALVLVGEGGPACLAAFACMP